MTRTSDHSGTTPGAGSPSAASGASPDAPAAADPGLKAAARAAVELVRSGDWVGLGTGRAASAFIDALGDRVAGGLAATAVATSEASARRAQSRGIVLSGLEEGQLLELIVDGADEVAPNLDLLKGRGGAMVRERIVAAASKRQVILVGPDKLVSGLGACGTLPVEIIPMARGLALHHLKLLGLRPTVRLTANVIAAPAAPEPEPFLSENGNLIVDCGLAAPLAGREAGRALEIALLAIPGLVDTGLFLGTCERVLVGHPDGRVEVLTHPIVTVPDEDVV